MSGDATDGAEDEATGDEGSVDADRRSGDSQGDLPTRTAVGMPPPKGMRLMPRGTAIGRYILVDLVGVGGMGMVYRAFDPELDRSVAVKLIGSADDSEEGRARLLREAQAMARLSHNNVVGVLDVGTVGDQVFLAMEMLDGQTLRDWLQLPRPWRDVVRAFADAGRGLAAAHGAGLVHRDFKPANAFVETSGRVRLLDFGLARPADALTTPDSVERSDDDEPSRDRSDSSGGATPRTPGGIYASVTRAGRIPGTPRYMAPEQVATGNATALSDQYAFCVALCEALYIKKPQPDTAERELRGPGPRRLRALVARGLRKDPSERFASMEHLVATLERALVHRRWLVLAAVSVAVVAGALVAFAARGDDPGERCRRADARISAAWHPSSALALRSGFAATGRPYAADAAARVVDGLDRYAAAWRDARRDACEATWVRGEQSSELLDRRMACLDRRLASLRGFVGVVSQGVTADIVDRAVGGLPTASDLAACADAAALLEGGDLPASREARAAIAALEAELEEASTLRFAGRYPEAIAAARSVAEGARARGRMPLVAEAVYLVGDVQQVASDPHGALASLDEAIEVAAQARYPKVVARAAILQVYVVGDLLGRGDEAIGIARLARAHTQMLGNPPRFVAALRNNLGNVYFEKGRYDDAYREYKATIDIELEVFGPEHIDVAWSWGNLGRVLLAQGKLVEARDHFQRAADIAERALGSRHPVLAPFLANLALVVLELGQPEVARGHVERSIAIMEAAGGRKRHRVAELLVVAADVANGQGRHRDALVACDEALAIDTAILDPDHTAIGRIERCRGRALVALGRERDAVPALERALAILTARNQDPLEAAGAEVPLASALWSSGDRTRAIALARKARATYAAATGRGREVADLDRWLAAQPR